MDVWTARKRFWKQIRKSQGCWIWQGGVGDGYGTFRIGYHTLQANRVALMLKLKRLLKGLACHTCDTPLCCRMRHLYEGTDASNIADRDERGRTAKGSRHGRHTKPWTTARGEQNGQAKLSDKDVQAIKKRYATGQCTQTELAYRFHVTQSHVSKIVRSESRKVAVMVGQTRPAAGGKRGG